jgi:hypothetical protein
MQHDEVIIDSHGKFHVDHFSIEIRDGLRKVFNNLNKQALKPSRIIMSEEDYKDILKWQNDK